MKIENGLHGLRGIHGLGGIRGLHGLQPGHTLGFSRQVLAVLLLLTQERNTILMAWQIFMLFVSKLVIN